MYRKYLEKYENLKFIKNKILQFRNLLPIDDVIFRLKNNSQNLSKFRPQIKMKIFLNSELLKAIDFNNQIDEITSKFSKKSKLTILDL